MRLARNRKFFGLIFSKEGVSPDPGKVEAIIKADRPVSMKELSSFLGMASYSACFISDFATVAAHFLGVNSERYKMGMEGCSRRCFSEIKTEFF